MTNCCELVENGYINCQKCTENKIGIDKNIYKKFLKGEKLNKPEINELKLIHTKCIKE